MLIINNIKIYIYMAQRNIRFLCIYLLEMINWFYRINTNIYGWVIVAKDWKFCLVLSVVLVQLLFMWIWQLFQIGFCKSVVCRWQVQCVFWHMSTGDQTHNTLLNVYSECIIQVITSTEYVFVVWFLQESGTTLCNCSCTCLSKNCTLQWLLQTNFMVFKIIAL